MQIQWYPGHMTKAVRNMKEDIKNVDLCIELVDARVPHSSRNPDIDTLAAGKYRLVLLSKADLADEKENRKWISYFKEKGITAIYLDARAKNSMKEIQNMIPVICKEKLERDARRGFLNRAIKAIVVGIPNVGKSTFINSFAGRAAAITGNKPGVTKGNQWIRLNKQVELLDTPGILWPKFEDQNVGLHLAFIGSINEDIINCEELCYEFVQYLQKIGQIELLEKRYAIPSDFMAEHTDPNEIIEEIALLKHAVKRGNVADIEKISNMILDDFRQGKLGRITLESASNE